MGTSSFTNAQIAEHYSVCVKLSTENVSVKLINDIYYYFLINFVNFNLYRKSTPRTHLVYT